MARNKPLIIGVVAILLIGLLGISLYFGLVQQGIINEGVLSVYG